MNAFAPSAALVSVSIARAALGVGAAGVLAAIEDGRIEWAFDVAVRVGGRRELRILAACLGGAAVPRDLNGVLVSILGHQRQRFRGSEVQRILLCSSPHVKCLHEAGELSGEIIGHTRHITRASLAGFLRRRRVA